MEDPIINNLVETENQLNELNQEVVAILDDYQTTNKSEASFFNFDNSFFLLTLVGLFMLAFALWFLQQELKHSRPKKEKIVKHIKPEVKVAPKIEEKKVEKKVEKPKKEVKSKAKEKVNNNDGWESF